MTDGTNPDWRLLAERLDRNHAEDRADIARLERQVAEIPAAMDRYVLVRVYEADQRAIAAQLARLEDEKKTDRAAGRSWVLGIAMTVVGAAAGIAAQLLTARGH